MRESTFFTILSGACFFAAGFFFFDGHFLPLIAIGAVYSVGGSVLRALGR